MFLIKIGPHLPRGACKMVRFQTSLIENAVVSPYGGLGWCRRKIERETILVTFDRSKHIYPEVHVKWYDFKLL